MEMLTIEARSMARRQPLVPACQVPLPVGVAEEGLTLRGLIIHLVTAEVGAFRDRQQGRGLLRVLSRDEIASGAARGKVTSRGRDLVQEVDTDLAIAAALEAFEDGIYLVLLDGLEQSELDRPLNLSPDSRVTFLRLVLLAGG